MGYSTQKYVTQNNLQFERANILYNLAALYSQLATACRDTAQTGLKAACSYYSASAGVLGFLQESVIPGLRSTPPEDMDAVTLACLEQLMLAQAQECFWLKAVSSDSSSATTNTAGNNSGSIGSSSKKDSVIARLAASVSDYFDAAAEFGAKSSAIRTEWVYHMSAKHHHFAAAAQYRQARDCLERAKYGEEIARLSESLNTVRNALVQSRYLNEQVRHDLEGLKEKVTDVLKNAEKDNDMIYLCMLRLCTGGEEKKSGLTFTTQSRSCACRGISSPDIQSVNGDLADPQGGVRRPQHALRHGPVRCAAVC